MLMLGQIPVQEVVDASGRLSEIGIVGILLFFLLFLLLGVGLVTWAVYRQLFGTSHKTGLIPKAFEDHNEFLKRVATAIEQVAKTSENTAETTAKIDSTVNKMHEFIRKSNIDIETVSKVWKHHILILKRIAIKIGIFEEVESQLNDMERILNP